MEKYPDAKMIHTVRNPESWYKSFGNTIVRQSKPSLKQILSMTLRLPFSAKLRGQLRVFKFAGKFMKKFMPDGFENKDKTIAAFNQWNKDVMNTVPKEKLLVYDVKEGWGPLCIFLNVPVPENPFPHSNTTAEFNARKI
jgi:hypothetical protein